MYADDLVLICDSVPEMRQCIAIIEKWSSETNMVVNKAKCGVLEVPVRASSKDPVLVFQREYWGYPVVDNYKYLGTMLDRTLDLGAHISMIGRKVAWLTARMTPVRNLKDLRLNLNLYKTLIEPLVSMGIAIYLRTTRTKQKEYVTYANKALKKFCLLPRSLPHDILNLLIEPADNRWRRKFEGMWLRDVRHRNYWIELFDFPNFELFDKSKDIADIPGMERRDEIRTATAEPGLLPAFPRQPKPRTIPANFTDLMWTINQHKCKDHKSTCRQRHLKEHNIDLPLKNWLAQHQDKEQRVKVETEIATAIAEIRRL